MDLIEPTRGDLGGFEFDWLLRDADGALALCETAGYGEVPDTVLGRGTETLERYSGAIRAILEHAPETGGCRQEHGGVHKDLETLGYGARGLYVFDWKHWSGPYRRIVVPDRPALAQAFTRILGEFLDLAPTAPVSFARVKRFQLPRLLPCRRLGA